MIIKLSILYLFYVVSLCYNLSINRFNLNNNKLHNSNNMRLRKSFKSSMSSRLKLFNTNTSSSDNIFHNTNSYYNKNKIISNISNNINKIYLSYNNNYSLIFYKDGYIEQNINRTLKLKPEQDILEVHLVSMKYFCKLYNDLCYTHNITNKTLI